MIPMGKTISTKNSATSAAVVSQRQPPICMTRGRNPLPLMVWYFSACFEKFPYSRSKNTMMTSMTTENAEASP